MSNLPTQQRGHALELCDGTTGHFVQRVAFRDTPERAEAITKALRAYPDLLSQRDELAEALRALVDDDEADDADSDRKRRYFENARTILSKLSQP